MKIVALVCALFFCMTASAQNPPDPILQSSQMPTYPPDGLRTRTEGPVKISFVLDEKGNVDHLDVISGELSLRGAATAVVRSWKFQLPRGLFRTEWRYETTFEYRFSGRELESGQTTKLTVTFDSFHSIQVVSDAFKPIIQKQESIPTAIH